MIKSSITFMGKENDTEVANDEESAVNDIEVHVNLSSPRF